MKRYILTAAAALLTISLLNASAAYAGDKPRYLTNGAFDNLFVQAGAGVNGIIDNGFTDFSSFAVDAAFGKWWMPGLGVRIGYTGFRNKPAESYGWFSGNNPYGYHHGHVDVLWNFINTFWGYKEKRFYTLSPYVHGGAIVFSYDAKSHAEIAYGAGLFNQFRLTSALGLFLDARVSFTRSEGLKQTGTVLILPTATAGMLWNFGAKTYTFTPYEKQVEYVKVEVLKDCDHEAKIHALEEEIARKEKAKELTPQQKEVIVEKYLNQGMVTYFVIDKWGLSTKEKFHLEDFLKYVPDGATLTIVGHADEETGSHRRNTKLAQERVRVVREALIQLGFKGNIVVEALGDTANPFKGRAPKNRCVTIQYSKAD